MVRCSCKRMFCLRGASELSLQHIRMSIHPAALRQQKRISECVDFLLRIMNSSEQARHAPYWCIQLRLWQLNTFSHSADASDKSFPSRSQKREHKSLPLITKVIFCHFHIWWPKFVFKYIAIVLLSLRVWKNTNVKCVRENSLSQPTWSVTCWSTPACRLAIPCLFLASAPAVSRAPRAGSWAPGLRGKKPNPELLLLGRLKAACWVWDWAEVRRSFNRIQGLHWLCFRPRLQLSETV